MRTLTISLSLLALLGACVEPAAPPPPPVEAATAAPLGAPHAVARASLLAADALLGASIALAGEADGLWPWLTDDAQYLHPGQDLLVGRAAARAFLRAAYPDPAAQELALHRITGDVSADAHLGYTFGWFDGSAGGAPRWGKYIAAWVRGPGVWRLAAFVRIPASRAPSPPPPGAGILDGEHGVPHPAPAAAVRAQALAADAAFAAQSVAEGYTEAFTAFCAGAAVVVAGSDFYWDRAGVELAWSGWTPAEELAWTPRFGAGAASGDLAYTVGTGTFSFDDGTAVTRSYSKYLTIWIREASGAWRWLLDGGNARPAPAP